MSNELGDAFGTAQDRAGNRHDRQLADVRTGEGGELEQAQEGQEGQEDWEDAALHLESARCVEMGDSAAQEAQEVQDHHSPYLPPDPAALADLAHYQEVEGH